MSTHIITIDGGNGVGKSSLVAALKELYTARGFKVLGISGGDLYRTLSWLTFVNAGESQDHAAATPAEVTLELARTANVQLVRGQVLVNGVVIERAHLRNPQMSHLVPQLAANPVLRAYVDDLLIADAAAFDGLVIGDGRDMGTTVFSQAEVKIFLTVDDLVAAHRQGEPIELVRERNRRDTERTAGPLRCPEGAVVIDTSHISLEEKIALAEAAITNKLPALGGPVVTHGLGLETEMLNAVVDGSKTVEPRLARGKFLLYQVGDVLSLREDLYEDGVEVGTIPDRARVAITAIDHYPSFAALLAERGYKTSIPWAGSVEEALSALRRFYTAEDEARCGVLAIEFVLLQP